MVLRIRAAGLGARAPRRRRGLARPAGRPGLSRAAAGGGRRRVPAAPRPRRAGPRDRRVPDLPRASSAASRPRRSAPIAATSRTSPTRAAHARDWADGPDAALRYLAARTRRGRRRDPGLAPTSLRRRAAAIKGFYRFAFGEGLITDRRRGPPRPAAHAAAAARDADPVAEVERLLEAPARRTATRSSRPGAPRAAVRGRPARLRGARPRSRGPVARRRVRAGHRQGRQGAARAGRRRRARRARDVDRRPARRPPRGAPRRAASAAGPLFLADRGRRLRPAAGVGGGQASGRAAPGSPTGSARTRSATRSRPTCSRAGPTCGSSRSCSDMRVSARRSSTPT